MSRRIRHVRDVARLMNRALASGGRVVGPQQVLWDCSAGCANPFRVTLEGRSAGFGQSAFQQNAQPVMGFDFDGFEGKGSYPDLPLWLDIDTPCRRCEPCLKRRAVRWAARARNELARAPRTWFCTFTADPEAHFRMECAAAARVAKVRTMQWADLTPEEQFLERAAEFGRELTKYFKRIRKESGIPLRYILVAEAHKSGLPHFHALVHEVAPDRPVRYRTLATQWRLGFFQGKLVEASAGTPAAWYVCKYLSKAALARVRASVRYGKDPLQGRSVGPC